MDAKADRETVDPWPATDEEHALRERLRAAGVQVATQPLDRPRILVRKRPRWLAFLVALTRRSA
ncbi:MAG TPA: hypothetical protein VJT67_09085 [Longimicrobiaceae bacterium]|nr:hypothetical protein [Longimicrobiaceae bacterium]